MDIIEAIDRRISCRAFTNEPVEGEKYEALAAEVERINETSDLRFQLYGPREDGTAIDMSPNMFAGNPPCYAALVGPVGPVPEEQLGYYGERLILFATQLGLGTCWVASTYDATTARAVIAQGEKLHDVVPIGYAPKKMPLKQRTIRKAIRGRDKKLSSLWQGPVSLDEAPMWVQSCVTAVHKGPSAINEQPVVFLQEAENGPIRAELSQVKTGQEYTDLGIAKLHFELVAKAHGVSGRWEWGSGGAFVIEGDEFGQMGE